MKHVKEWVTCDRCGKLINKSPSFLPFVETKIVKASEILQYVSEAESYTAGIKCLPNSDYCEMEIVNGYSSKIIKYHLCESCRKNFDKFMKNKL